jgi:hypothetical protein
MKRKENVFLCCTVQHRFLEGVARELPEEGGPGHADAARDVVLVILDQRQIEFGQAPRRWPPSSR